MGRVKRFGAIGAAAAMVLALGGAQQPSALKQTQGGLWEVSGFPGSKAPVRQCVAQAIALARIEHRGQSCAHTVLSDSGSSAVVEYRCRNGDFGQTRMTVITPRSLRIETQGISRAYPFNYVVQARRIGDCPAH